MTAELHVLRGASRWIPIALTGILIAAALLYTWNIGYSGLSTYYASAVKSMAANPRALFFGALDPTASTTLDKLAGFLVPQVLFTKIFGFQAWALSLPQAIEGVVTVYYAYVIGARWRGPVTGLAMAGVVAFTPMLAAMFGRPMEDGMLTMCQVLAFAALQRAIRSQRWGWLIGSAAWVALGFQAKMLQSWLFIPVLIVAWLIGSNSPLRRRIVKIVVACLACVVLSVSWMTAIQLVPASSRPYIDGTTNNNIYSMVFGYNGVDRLIPGLIPGAVPQLGTVKGAGQSSGNTTATSSAGASKAKLVMPQFSTQIGWLYPLAGAGLILGLIRIRRMRRFSSSTAGRAPPVRARDRQLAATGAGLATWLLVAVVVLSLAFVPHATYFAVIAVPLAAFAVDAAITSIRLFRANRDWRWMLLPILIALQTAWTVVIMLEASPRLRGLVVVAVAGGVCGIALCLAAHFRGAAGRRLAWSGLVAAGAAALVGPVVWSLCVIGPGGGGSASDAFAGPRLAAPTASTVAAAKAHPGGFTLRPPFTAPAVAPLSAEDDKLLDYVDTRNAPGAVAFATDSMPIAVAIILQTGDDPVPMGGFSQQAPTPTIAQLRARISAGTLRFVLLYATNPISLTPPNATLAADRAWVRANCSAVLEGRFRDGVARHQILYDCNAAG